MARMIRDWTDSARVDKLNCQAEVFFHRLCMKADDYGSYHANPKLLKSLLYPLRSDSIRETDIIRWMAECQKADLILFYDVDDKPYVRIKRFGQRLRNKKKRFPDIPQHLAASCGDPPSEVEEEIELEKEGEGEGEDARAPAFFKKNERKENTGAGPKFSQVLEFFESQVKDNWKPGKISIESQKFFNHYEAMGWKIRGQKIEVWQAKANEWIIKEIQNGKD